MKVITRTACILVFVIGVVISSGCATAIICMDGKRPDDDRFPTVYPATCFDAEVIGNMFILKVPDLGWWSSGSYNIGERLLWSLTAGTLATIDLPIAIVTDTVFLPVDLYRYNRRQKGSEEKADVEPEVE